ncbi:hypothetical protein [Thermosulfurimonas dismutans]|uniref:Uncharacterized protein n=1 Tax=Thermosulfurimonas dismutans TaxID=999894 RepID=A0A179D640_9BACT|nr:hypothetical protein [Thermosulfurimonas dismutans]OAQ21506.1 hypothetical protein TDIS_0024 [Thermosulfurimonas dismutans]
MKIFVLSRPESWESFREIVQVLPKDKSSYKLLVKGAGVTRCLRCEPTLFPYFHQFVLDGGRAYICRKSLKAFGIPENRPPDLFERVTDGQLWLRNLSEEGFEVEEL